MRNSALLLLAALAAGSLAGPAAAKKDDAVLVCHRTGQKAPAGFFRGHVLSVPESGARAHLGHGDLRVPSAAFKFFVSSKECLVKDGRLYDGKGNPTDVTPPPGDDGGPGIAPPPTGGSGGSGSEEPKPPKGDEGTPG